MGLDMYLYADAYLSGWDHSTQSEKDSARAAVVAANLDHLFSDRSPGVQVRVTAAYWRKANAIHGWFVEHVQNGVDEGQESHVSLDTLRTLHETCVFVLASCEVVPDMVARGYRSTGQVDIIAAVLAEREAQEAIRNGEGRPERDPVWEPILEVGTVVLDPSVAQEHLPTRDGFYFGSTEYDEGYIADLVDTIEQLRPIIEHYDRNPQDVDFYYYASW